METAWLIYSKQDAIENSSYIDWFIEEASKQNITMLLIYREDLQIGIYNHKLLITVCKKQVELPTIAIVRTIEPLLNLHLEALGVHVFNSSTVSTICNNKALTHFEVNKLGIPMVYTLFMNKDNLLPIPPMDYPFVVKETNGRGGKQVHFIQNVAQWEKCRTQLGHRELIIQAINVQPGKDIRVFVIGKEIIGAVLRESKTDLRANFKLGGSASWYELQAEEKEMIHKIIRHFDFGMVGIDFLIDYQQNLLFNEIEDVVGSRTLSAVSQINILEKYITYIKKTVAEFHS